MSKILPLGAINRKTREYVYPRVANKKDEYICPDCNKDLILCKGEFIRPYFRHKVDSINPCHHYSNPSESQIHKDAKILLKNLLERKIPISFTRECCSCKIVEEFDIPEMTETSTIRMEYGFQYNGSLQVADVAYLDNGEIFTLFEICHTHKTCSEKRPEPWFEIDAENLIRLANDDTLNSLQIPCIRCEKCEECTQRENNKIKAHKDELEKYVRIKLGQKYPVPDYDEYGRIVHDRIDFHANCCFALYTGVYGSDNDCDCGLCRGDNDNEEGINNNKKIIELFHDDFNKLSSPLKKYVVIRSYKGSCAAFIVSEEDYKKNNYWTYFEFWSQEQDDDNNYNFVHREPVHPEDIRLPYDKIIDMNTKGTIQIIVELILYFESLKR
jgi:hypothetical protein